MSFRTFEASPALQDGLRFVTVKSAALGQRADLTLWAPEGHPGPLPLVILLHGVHGSHWAWALKGDAHRTAARLIAQGEIPPLALAMPSDGLWGDGSGYLPHAHQDFERWIVDEVPLAARALGCVTEASPLAIAGLSMGGWGALRLGARHPGRFVAAAGLSSMTEPAQFAGLVQEDRRHWQFGPGDGSVRAALLSAPSLPPLHFSCGVDDPFIEGNRALHAALRAAKVPHHYAEAPGGHTWAYWRDHLPEALRFVSQHFPPTP